MTDMEDRNRGVNGRRGWMRPHGGAAALLALLALVAGLPDGGAAQDGFDAIVARCEAEDPSLAVPCVERVLGLQAARGALGLTMAGGADLPGSASTLGRRLGETPRVGANFRFGLTRNHLPGAEVGGGLAGDETAWLTSIRGGLAAGVFDGFSLAPTVGGVLSLDILGDLGLVFAEEGDGFDGSVTAVGVGLRLGVFRESFTLPGVTLTATRRWAGDVAFGLAGVGSPGDEGEGTEFSTTVTSLRGTVGKEFFAFGVLAGVGWERYEGDAIVRIGPGEGGTVRTVRADELVGDRALFFGGVSYSLLIAQLSAEAGWARGFDEPAGRDPGANAYEPGAGALFGALALRLIL